MRAADDGRRPALVAIETASQRRSVREREQAHASAWMSDYATAHYASNPQSPSSVARGLTMGDDAFYRTSAWGREMPARVLARASRDRRAEVVTIASRIVLAITFGGLLGAIVWRNIPQFISWLAGCTTTC